MHGIAKSRRGRHGAPQDVVPQPPTAQRTDGVDALHRIAQDGDVGARGVSGGHNSRRYTDAAMPRTEDNRFSADALRRLSDANLRILRQVPVSVLRDGGGRDDGGFVSTDRAHASDVRDPMHVTDGLSHLHGRDDTDARHFGAARDPSVIPPLKDIRNVDVGIAPNDAAFDLAAFASFVRGSAFDGVQHAADSSVHHQRGRDRTNPMPDGFGDTEPDDAAARAAWGPTSDGFRAGSGADNMPVVMAQNDWMTFMQGMPTAATRTLISDGSDDMAWRVTDDVGAARARDATDLGTHAADDLSRRRHTDRRFGRDGDMQGAAARAYAPQRDSARTGIMHARAYGDRDADGHTSRAAPHQRAFPPPDAAGARAAHALAYAARDDKSLDIGHGASAMRRGAGYRGSKTGAAMADMADRTHSAGQINAFANMGSASSRFQAPHEPLRDTVARPSSARRTMPVGGSGGDPRANVSYGSAAMANAGAGAGFPHAAATRAGGTHAARPRTQRPTWTAAGAVDVLGDRVRTSDHAADTSGAPPSTMGRAPAIARHGTSAHIMRDRDAAATHFRASSGAAGDAYDLHGDGGPHRSGDGRSHRGNRGRDLLGDRRIRTAAGGLAANPVRARRFV